VALEGESGVKVESQKLEKFSLVHGNGETVEGEIRQRYWVAVVGLGEIPHEDHRFGFGRMNA